MTALHLHRGPLDVYPGTHRPFGTPHPVFDNRPVLGGWDQDPIYKQYSGAMREFFAISALAQAINRSTKTIYKWEDQGLFPPATFIYNSSSKQGRRRLYTRLQIEGIVRIAADEGVLDGRKRFLSHTRFPARAFEHFRATRTTLPPPLTDGISHD
ncbi:hypothetical protein ABZ543_12835 [Streptomyces roseifaciens]